jgi:hypothetical protein
MVYEPGGYNFMDYIKLGLPLQILCGIFTVAIVFSIDYWWVYAVVLAVLSPLAVGVFFFLGCNKPHPNQLALDDATDVKSASLLESGELPAPAGSQAAGIEAASRHENGEGGAGLCQPDAIAQPTTSSDVIFTGCA